MRMCEGYIKRFSLVIQENPVAELSEFEIAEYQSIYNMLINKLEESGGEVPENSDLQIINQIYTCNNECVTPLGLVNVSLEYLAKLLTFCKQENIQWLVDVRECTDTHFRELSYYKIIVACTREKFINLATSKGFKYSAKYFDNEKVS